MAVDRSAASEREPLLVDALAEVLATIRFREPYVEWLAWRSDAISRAKSLLTEAELERGEKMRTLATDYEDLARG